MEVAYYNNKITLITIRTNVQVTHNNNKITLITMIINK